MTTVVNQVSKKINKKCIVSGRLKKNGCKVSLSKFPTSRVIVDFDKSGSPISAKASRCDYLVVTYTEAQNNWVFLLELKNGALDASKVVKQLQATSVAVEKLISAKTSLKFRPIAFSNGRNRRQLKELKSKKNRITFHGRKEVVRGLKCGATLQEMISLG